MWWQVVARDPAESQGCSSVQNTSMLHPFFAHLVTEHEAFEGTRAALNLCLKFALTAVVLARTRTWPSAKVHSVIAHFARLFHVAFILLLFCDRVRHLNIRYRIFICCIYLSSLISQVR